MPENVEFYFVAKNAPKTAKDIEGVEGAVKKTSKASKKATDDFGKFLGKLALGAAAASAINKIWSATDTFNKKLGDLKTLGPEVQAQIGSIEQGFLDIAGPIGSIEELTTAAYDAISGGIEPAKVVQFMADTAGFARGNIIELGNAVDVTTTIMNTYGEKAGSARVIQDQLTMAIRLGKVRGDELAASYGGIAGTANTVGISFKDLNAFFITATAGGIKFSEAVSSMKGIISNIAQPTEAAKKAAEGMAGGFSLASLKSQGLAGFLKSMTTHVEGNTQAQKDLFGSVEAFNAIAVVTSEQGAKKFSDALVALDNSSGAAKDSIKQQELTIEGLRNQIEATFVKVFLPVLRDVLNWVNDNKATIIGFFESLLGAFELIADVAVEAGKAVIYMVDMLKQGIPLIGAIVDGWNKLLNAGKGLRELQGQTEKFTQQVKSLKEQGEAAADKFSSFMKTLDDESFIKMHDAMGPIPDDLKDGGDMAKYFNDIMKGLLRGDYGPELKKQYEIFKNELIATRPVITSTTDNLENQKNKTNDLKDATKSFKDILIPATTATKNYGVDLLPRVNEQLERQLDLFPDVNFEIDSQKIAAELLKKELKKLETQLGLIYGGMEALSKAIDLVDFGGLSDEINSFFSGGADIAAGIATLSTDLLGGIEKIVGGIGKLADILGGTNWESQGRAFNAAMGNLIPAEMMGQFISLGEEMGNFTDAWREMMDEVIAASEIETGEDMWVWIQEIARQVKGLAAGGGDIDQLGDAFAALAEKGTENLGYLGRDFQILIASIQGTEEEMQALTNFLETEATAGLEGYIAMMEAGFTNVVIPTYEDAKDWQNKLADNSTLIAGIEGMIRATEAFGNTNQEVFQQDLAAFMAQTSDAYNTLIGNAFSHDEALQLLVPQLQTLNQMASDYNLTLDAGTQALIDQAIEAGYNMEVQESSQSIMKAGFEGLTEAIDNLTRAITGDMNDAIVGIGKTVIDITDTSNIRFTDMGNNMVAQIDRAGESFEDLADYVNTTPLNPTFSGNLPTIGFQAGTPPGGFVVPPGYPRDDFPIGVSSGERVFVQPRGQTGVMQAPTNINIDVTINAAPGGETAESLSRKFLEAWRYNVGSIQEKVRQKVA